MRADRLLSILMFLQVRGRMTAQELAEELEVSERTIYRDLEALHAAGVPVLAERGPGGGCTLPDKYRTDLTGLTESEVRGLFLASMPGPLADLGLGKAAEAAMLKLTASLPPAHRQDIERVRGRIHVDTAPWFRPEEPVPFLPILQEALWQQRRLMMKYRRGQGMRITREVNPYGLVAKASIWYLVASVGSRVMTYRVSRILDAELTPDRFERPGDFDLARFWADWCAEFEASVPKYPVTLRVSPDFIDTLPTFLGEGVRALLSLAGPPDERGRVTINLTYESYTSALGHTLALGSGAEVLHPEELRRGLLDMASRVVDLYTREL